MRGPIHRCTCGTPMELDEWGEEYCPDCEDIGSGHDYEGDPLDTVDWMTEDEEAA